GVTVLLLGVAAWSVRLGLVEAPWWVLAAWGAAIVSFVVICLMAWRDRARLTSGGIASAMERGGSWRHGALTSLLDSPALGTSDTRLAMADRAQAADLQRRGLDAVAPLKRAIRWFGVVGAACLVAGLLAFV